MRLLPFGGRRFILVVPLTICTVASLQSWAQPLGLDEVYQRIIENNPRLKAAEGRIRAAGHGVRQSRLFPNPELEIGTENLGLNEVEASVTQPLELFGRRKAGADLARAKRSVAEAELDARRLELRAEALRRFSHAVAIRHMIALVDSQHALARADRHRILRRVEAGAAMEVDVDRAEMAIVEIELRGRELEVEYGSALRDVSRLWGDSSVAAWEPAGTLVSDFAPPSLVQAKQDAMGHPELQLLAREREAARAALAGTRTERYPETAVSGGYLRNNEEGEGGVLLGLSLSIPLFDRKQGAIAQGTSGIEALEQETAAERLSRLGRIERVHAAMVLLEEKMGRYRETILPKAARILASLTGYYERGMVDILDVLEARAVAIEKEVESIELREQWATLAAELLELAGTEVKVVE